MFTITIGQPQWLYAFIKPFSAQDTINSTDYIVGDDDDDVQDDNSPIFFGAQNQCLTGSAGSR